MRIRPRDFFDDEPFQNAMNEYRAKCSALLDPHQGYEMLWRYGETLGRELEYVKAKHTKLHDADRQSVNNAEILVLNPAREHARNDISILSRTLQDISRSNYQVEDWIKDGMRKVLALLDQNTIFVRGKELNPQFVKKLFPKNTSEIWQRYEALDGIYETGITSAIDLPSRMDRARELAKIPEEVRAAKWKFMLAYADAAYHIDIGHLKGSSLGQNHLILLSNLLARLEMRERGADNEHIPDTHKYRHNPAIHSLNTVSLADAMFHAVLREIDYDPQLSKAEKHRYAERLGAMRGTVYHAALVHDIGEADGELSQGIIVADMDPTLRIESKKIRAVLENETFEHYLNLQRPKLRHIENGRMTAEPITDREWNEIFHSYKEASELSERTDTFLGRFFKTLECMQSQHDMLRYSEKPGAKPLIESGESNKIFSVNYAVKSFDDAEWNASCPGPNSLVYLAEKAQGPDAAIDIELQRMLTAEMKNELRSITAKNVEAYYGPNSPEMLQLRLKERRPASVAL